MWAKTNFRTCIFVLVGSFFYNVGQGHALLSSQYISNSNDYIHPNHLTHRRKWPYTNMIRMNQNDNTNESFSHAPINNNKKELFNRRSFSQNSLLLLASSAFLDRKKACAAPPMAVIAEELGYFPVTNRNGDTIYVSARVKRRSTEQAIALAEYLKASGAVMYGAFWCPHCQRQKEMFGREAWELITYVECDARGAGSDKRKCIKEGVEGFPTWKFKGGREASGEMPLIQLAKASGYKGGFDGGLEPVMEASSGSCG